MKKELKICQEKLSKYSLIEKQHNYSPLDVLSSLNLSQKQQAAESQMDHVISLHKELFEERRASLEHMLKLTIETILSLPYKFLLWSAENNSGPYNIENVDVTGRMRPSHNDEWGIFLEEVKANETEVMKVYELKSIFASSATKLKAAVENLVKVHEEIHAELKEIHEKVCNKLLPNLNPSSICSFLKWIYYKVNYTI